ncbi:hypothetical protein S83_054392 [Arachis hypogaea]|uniref:Uncharacterized protein n=1 Tax=Arachis hypogaea TaxID=3818 RepID=A0A444YKG0_ARAHY|nr:hypothetical protein Ahy_B06g081221 [Arachis hypogaea]
MFSVMEFMRFNFDAEEEAAAISEKVLDHKTIARLQLADAKDVLEGIQDVKGVSFPILTPNLNIPFMMEEMFRSMSDIRLSEMEVDPPPIFSQRSDFQFLLQHIESNSQ